MRGRRRRRKRKAERATKAKGWLPDAEVRAAGVVAADGGHSARVRAYVTRPGLGDVKGAVGIHPHAGDGLDVDHRALFFPDMPRIQCQSSVGVIIITTICIGRSV